MRIDLYCRVVDNFGDAGVCWRLARQLALEFGVRVRLVCDRPELVARLATGVLALPTAPLPERVDGVTLVAWAASGAGNEDDENDGRDGSDEVDPRKAAGAPADAIVAAFQCMLPETVQERLRQAPDRAPLWINLDYLSAESWVGAAHGRPSPKPAGGVEWFFMPGFDPGSGGLIRERTVAAGGDAEHGGDSTAGDDSETEADSSASVFDGPLRRRPGALAVSLFCYPQAPVGALCAALAARGQPVDLYRAADPTRDADGRLDTARYPAGALRVHPLPWLSQPRFDALLAGCDLNFVRGEDSWVRAIWAGKPFIWMPYQQPDHAHHVKLEAFLARLAPFFDTEAMAAVSALSRAWSSMASPADGDALPADSDAALAHALSRFEARREAIAAGFIAFRAQLLRQSDLATRLIEFVRSNRPLL